MSRSFPPSGARRPARAGPTSSPNQVLGVLERITFHNPENGYTVGKLVADEFGPEEITITGNFTGPVVGQCLRCEGVWINHPQWGRQMQVRTYETIVPATAAAIEKYLGSGMVKGIGPVCAQRIVAEFGDESLDVIEKSPRKLLQVKGIGEKLLERIMKAWVEQQAIRNIMIFLQSHGVTPVIASKIYKQYRERSIEVVENNPYQLATDIWGVGFKTADKIAQNMGFALDDPRRLVAGVVYTLNSAVETGGNVYLTREQLAEAAEQMLGTREIDESLAELTASGKLIRELSAPELDIGPQTGAPELEEAFYVPSLHAAESATARNIRRRCLSAFEPPPAIARDPAWVEKCLERHGVSLSEEQRAAVDLAMRSPFMVLTGGPGTGKTTTTRAVVHAFADLRMRVLLASPTGRAAKRLSEVTGFEASTIHRLLAFDPQMGGFRHGSESPLDCDVLIVDEASMIDIVLANALLRAVRMDGRVILIGDVDQLPSVGPGNFLRDVIASATAPVARLTQVFRQAAASRIITSAHQVNTGRIPDLPSPKADDGDFVFVGAEEAQELADKIVAIVANSLPKRGYPVSDIQVLVPMQRGAAGAIALNARLQATLNPPSPVKAELHHLGRAFRVGDRVIQLKNNYDLGVFNGDVGTITDISHEDQTVIVRMGEGAQVTYDFSECDEMALAYALTIHKSQGSEFPVAVIAVHSQHYVMLQRNLFYTAITRARRYAVVVGSAKAVAICVRNDKQTKRNTRLRQRLRGEI